MKTMFNYLPLRKNFFAFLLMIILAALNLSEAQAQEIITVQNGNTIDVQDATQVFVYNVKGMNMNVKGVDGNELSYKVFIKANENAMIRNFGGGRLYNKLTDGVLELYFDINDDDSSQNSSQNQSWIKSFFTSSSKSASVVKEAVLTLEIPKELLLKVKARYTNITLADMNKNLELTTRSGTIDVTNVGEDLLVFNDYGNTNAQNIKGYVTINSRSSTTELNNVGKQVKIDSDYSTIRLDKIGGSVEIVNKSGSIRAQNLAKDFDHRGNYTTIKLENIGGIVKIDDTSGSLDAENIGSLSLKGNYTDVLVDNVLLDHLVSIESKSSLVKLKNVNAPISIDGTYLKVNLQKSVGNIKIYNKNGDIDIEDCKGDIQIDGEYNEIELVDVDAKRVEAINRNGSIHAGLIGSPEIVIFRCRYGDVELKMNKSSIGKASLETSYGTIKHPLEASQIVREIKNTNDQILELKGNGKTEIQIRVENGSISIN